MNAIQAIPTNDLLSSVVATYGVGAVDESEQQAFIQRHVSEMERSSNEAVARSGYILSRAQEGFGLGYKVPLSIIVMGQSMLGINLATATPFIASNPAAFTAAALGAVYYGYQALSDEERDILHSKIGEALDFGIELIKTIARFSIDLMKSLLDPATLAQIKQFVAEIATAAGSSLYEVTGRLYDRVAGIAYSVGEVATSAGSYVGLTAGEAYARGRNLLSSRGPDPKRPDENS